ncbi:MAG TPA: PH domain-containing protein [Dehalococcoidia bacterium]|nr:PH domain-containing protein [Dehalococcoidia bacterium]
MIFQPPRTRGAAIAMLLAALAAILGIALLVRGFALSVSFGQWLCYTFAALLLALAALLGYWGWAGATLRYELRDGALAIRWGLVEHVVPLAAIERLVLGRHLPLPLVNGLRLPGLLVGRAHVNRVGATAVYLRCASPDAVVYLIAADGAVGLSVVDPQRFVRALQQAQTETAGAAPASGLRRSGAAMRGGLFADRRARLLAGATLLLAWLSAAIVYARYQSRPAALTIHFPPTESAHLAPRAELLHIPESAIVWCLIAGVLAALLFGRARTASFMLLAGSAIGSAVLCVAAIGAVG